MGLFDIPGPVLGLIDNLLGFAPPLLRLSFWAVVTGALSMLCYWVVSPQQAVADAKQSAIDARRALNSYEGHEFSEMWPLARHSLAASGRHFAVVLLPAVIGSLPALVFIVWVSNQYSYHVPEPGESITVTTAPPTMLALDATEDGTWVATYPPVNSPVAISTVTGETLVQLPLDGPVPVVHKKLWWNSLIGNAAGYLPADATVDEVRFGLREIRLHRIGPDWSQTWELPYFLILIVASLVIKSAFKID